MGHGTCAKSRVISRMKTTMDCTATCCGRLPGSARALEVADLAAGNRHDVACQVLEAGRRSERDRPDHACRRRRRIRNCANPARTARTQSFATCRRGPRRASGDGNHWNSNCRIQRTSTRSPQSAIRKNPDGHSEWTATSGRAHHCARGRREVRGWDGSIRTAAQASRRDAGLDLADGGALALVLQCDQSEAAFCPAQPKRSYRRRSSGRYLSSRPTCLDPRRPRVKAPASGRRATHPQRPLTDSLALPLATSPNPVGETASAWARLTYVDSTRAP